VCVRVCVSVCVCVCIDESTLTVVTSERVRDGMARDHTASTGDSTTPLDDDARSEGV